MSGEQFGEKWKLRREARMILLLQNRNSQWSWKGVEKSGIFRHSSIPCQPLDFLGSFRNEINVWKDGKKMLLMLHGQLRSEIPRITDVAYSRYKGAGWHTGKPRTAQRTATRNAATQIHAEGATETKARLEVHPKQQDSRSQRAWRFLPWKLRTVFYRHSKLLSSSQSP